MNRVYGTIRRYRLGMALVAWVLVAPTLLASSASAQEFGELELSGTFGLGSRASTGVGAPLDTYGYDTTAGGLAGIDARLLLHTSSNRYFRQGLRLSGEHMAGGFFSADGAPFHSTWLDATYVFRSLLPCMSSDSVSFYATAALGLTAVVADADTGHGAPDANQNLRESVGSELDHFSIGGTFRVGGHMVVDNTYLLGVDLAGREVASLSDGPVGRTSLLSATLRFGLKLNL